MSLPEEVVRQYEVIFGSRPAWLARAPGRVNLIGEHTDYNDGFVLPIAIDRATWIAAAPRADDRVVLHSLSQTETAKFALNGLDSAGEGWAAYVRAVALTFQERGAALRGWQGVLGSDVPIGAGLSSSAALELVVARVFATVADLAWDAAAMALLGQRAENRWVGMNCGIMDQMISASGVADHALLLDCRTLETQHVPLPKDVAVVVLDTGTRRGLVGSAYNERRSQCQQAAESLGVRALRDVTLDEFNRHFDRLDRLARRRARHVITEDARTLAAAEAMLANDPAAMGELMKSSHVSLRDDYEVSSRELDAMVECAQEIPECYGARMTGAGFGGCAVAIVKRHAATAFCDRVRLRYHEVTGLDPQTHICAATSGADIQPLKAV